MHSYHLLITKLKPATDHEIERLVRRSRIDQDWWQVGGRWTGCLKPDYSPEKDERNWETCTQCNGTGTRRDAIAMANNFKEGYCNGCSGHEKNTGRKGVRVKWPTEWAPTEFNHRLVSDVLVECEKLDAAISICPSSMIVDGRVVSVLTFAGAPFSKTDESSARKFVAALKEQPPSHWATVLDAHS
jgi:hypothetical protein